MGTKAVTELIDLVERFFKSKLDLVVTNYS